MGIIFLLKQLYSEEQVLTKKVRIQMIMIKKVIADYSLFIYYSYYFIMSKLFQLARKMEEQSTDKVAKGIIKSYKKFNKEIEEIEGRPPKNINRNFLNQKVQNREEEYQIALEIIKNKQQNPYVASELRHAINKQRVQKNSNENKDLINTQKSLDKKKQTHKSKINELKQKKKIVNQQLQKMQLQQKQKFKAIKLDLKSTDKQYQLFSIKLLTQKITKISLLVQRNLLQGSFFQIKNVYLKLKDKEEKFNKKIKLNIMRKYFEILHRETMIIKIEKEKQELMREIKKQQKNKEIAVDFYEFNTLRKAMKCWKRSNNLTLLQKKKQQKPKVIQESDLKNKVKNFINVIKQQIVEHNSPKKKQPIQSIKQEEKQSETSEIKLRSENDIVNQQQIQYDQQFQEEQIVQEEQSQRSEQSNPIEKKSIKNKKLTNQQLLKKREQLQKKHAERKKLFQKIRKQKQQEKKKQQEEKKNIQLRMKEEQKKKKQEEYKKFLKKKKDEQEAKQRQIQEKKHLEMLQVQAEEFDRYRLQKFYGLNPLKNLIVLRNQNTTKLYKKLQKAELKLSFVKFLQNYKYFNQQFQKKQVIKQKQAIKLYKKISKRKILNILQQHLQMARIEKQELKAHYFLNLMKRTIRLWKSSLGELRKQNFNLQKIENEKIGNYRNTILLKKCFNILLQNQKEQKKNANILQHKRRLQEKLKNLLIKEPQQINISMLLQ